MRVSSKIVSWLPEYPFFPRMLLPEREQKHKRTGAEKSLASCLELRRAMVEKNGHQLLECVRTAKRRPWAGKMVPTLPLATESETLRVVHHSGQGHLVKRIAGYHV